MVFTSSYPESSEPIPGQIRAQEILQTKISAGGIHPSISSDLQKMCEIGQSFLASTDWRATLSGITAKIRSLMIFDNLVVYRRQSNDALDVVHARAVGRGRASAEDIAWGEDLACQIIEKRQIIQKTAAGGKELNRLQRPFILGIPLLAGEKCYGAFLLIRFGGPDFEPGQIQLAQYIAQQIALLIDRQMYLGIEKILEEQSTQLQLQKDFISTISHELRSPLGFIKGYTTTLLREDAQWGQATQHEFLTIINQETDHMQTMIDNLLDSSRLQAGIVKMNYQQTHVDTLINNIIAREKVHHPQADIDFVIISQLRPIQTDPNRLGQVIENLISNAIKYAPGTRIIITLAQNQKLTTIDVKDHGRGIPDKYLPFLFERFFRVPDQPSTVHGSGLGLFICKQIVKAHGGEIWASSAPNEGTTIQIQLPN